MIDRIVSNLLEGFSYEDAVAEATKLPPRSDKYSKEFVKAFKGASRKIEQPGLKRGGAFLDKTAYKRNRDKKVKDDD